MANFDNTNLKITETMAHGYSSESTQQELSNEYQHDRVKMFFKNLCAFVTWKKVASALEGLTSYCTVPTINPCTKCVGSLGKIHDRLADCHTVSWALLYG